MAANDPAPMQFLPPRRRKLRGAWLLFLLSIVGIAGLVVLLMSGGGSGNPAAGPAQRPLLLYCAAGIKPPVEQIARDYEKLFGTPIQLQYGASHTLLAGAQASGQGDLFLPADESYIELARDKRLVAETLPVATMRPILAVRKSNPKQLRSLADLLTKDLRIVQANPDAAAVGKVTRDALRNSGQWDALAAKTTAFKGTVNDVANDLKLGAADAGFIWDAMLKQYPELEAVPAAELAGAQSRITVAVLARSEQPTAALRFARFLAASDQGLRHFATYGYAPAQGDAWVSQPEILLFSGAMLRPAIEQTIQQFEQREGCRVSRIYNGCGILVGEMKKAIGPMPDAYFSCDSSFMSQVKDLFVDTIDVSGNQLVILVPRGNPRKIRTLKDLGQPGLRIGVGHEKQCALGALTQNMLTEAGFYEPVRRNVAAESATGDMLVNQLRTGSLDAVIAYISNAAAGGEQIEAIAIDIPCAVATQPIGISKTSHNKQIAARLIEAIKTEESRQRFLANGFSWKIKPTPATTAPAGERR